MATATKKHAKTENTESKTARIRAYANAHRKATAKQIAAAVGCSVGLVHSVRGKKKRGQKKARPAVAHPTSPTQAELTPTEACVTFVRLAGGFAEAKKMLLTAEAFAGLKIR